MEQFKRGFKTQCETMAAQYRLALGLEPTAPLPAKKLAKHIGVRIVDIHRIPKLSPATIEHLIRKDAESWSALMITYREKKLAVINPSHSDGRKSSSLVHECSHCILNHTPLKVVNSTLGLMISAYDKNQENEADWLTGALLLPRIALLKIAYEGIDYEMHSDMYGVSEEMLRMRMDRTGVNLQMRRRAG